MRLDGGGGGEVLGDVNVIAKNSKFLYIYIYIYIYIYFANMEVTNYICLADVCAVVGVHVCDRVLDCVSSEVLQLLLPLPSPPHGRIHSTL